MYRCSRKELCTPLSCHSQPAPAVGKTFSTSDRYVSIFIKCWLALQIRETACEMLPFVVFMWKLWQVTKYLSGPFLILFLPKFAGERKKRSCSNHLLPSSYFLEEIYAFLKMKLKRVMFWETSRWVIVHWLNSLHNVLFSYSEHLDSCHFFEKTVSLRAVLASGRQTVCDNSTAHVIWAL